jgi:hypothetical protein
MKSRPWVPSWKSSQWSSLQCIRSRGPKTGAPLQGVPSRGSLPLGPNSPLQGFTSRGSLHGTRQVCPPGCPIQGVPPRCSPSGGLPFGSPIGVLLWDSIQGIPSMKSPPWGPFLEVLSKEFPPVYPLKGVRNRGFTSGGPLQGVPPRCPFEGVKSSALIRWSLEGSPQMGPIQLVPCRVFPQRTLQPVRSSGSHPQDQTQGVSSRAFLTEVPLSGSPPACPLLGVPSRGSPPGGAPKGSSLSVPTQGVPSTGPLHGSTTGPFQRFHSRCPSQVHVLWGPFQVPILWGLFQGSQSMFPSTAPHHVVPSSRTCQWNSLQCDPSRGLDPGAPNLAVEPRGFPQCGPTMWVTPSVSIQRGPFSGFISGGPLL